MDVNSFRLNNPITASAKVQKTKKIIKGKFLSTTPLSCLTIAGNLAGKALHVFIVVRFLSDVNRSDTFKLETKWLREFGVKRNAAYNALKLLEEASLIKVERHKGRLPVIMLLDLGKK